MKGPAGKKQKTEPVGRQGACEGATGKEKGTKKRQGSCEGATGKEKGTKKRQGSCEGVSMKEIEEMGQKGGRGVK